MTRNNRSYVQQFFTTFNSAREHKKISLKILIAALLCSSKLRKLKNPFAVRRQKATMKNWIVMKLCSFVWIRTHRVNFDVVPLTLNQLHGLGFLKR